MVVVLVEAGVGILDDEGVHHRDGGGRRQQQVRAHPRHRRLLIPGVLLAVLVCYLEVQLLLDWRAAPGNGFITLGLGRRLLPVLDAFVEGGRVGALLRAPVQWGTVINKGIVLRDFLGRHTFLEKGYPFV